MMLAPPTLQEHLQGRLREFVTLAKMGVSSHSPCRCVEYSEALTVLYYTSR